MSARVVKSEDVFLVQWHNFDTGRWQDVSEPFEEVVDALIAHADQPGYRVINRVTEVTEEVIKG